MEFTQCDADTIGSDSIIGDAEFIQMGIEALKTLGFEKFLANISNRKFLNGIIKYAGADDKEFIPICLSIDKLPKIGKERVKKELLEKRKISSKVANKILEIVTLEGKTDDLIKKLKIQLKDIPIALEGLNELEQIFDYLKSCNIDEQYYQFAPFIARGLAYYTGPIWEFEILEGNVGSVAGCGRYDNTIGRLTGLGKKIPATGGSFGIERIVEVIKNRKIVRIKSTPTQVLVTIFDRNYFKQSLKTANYLRKNNICTMLYSNPGKKLNKQLKYADKKNIPYVIIIGPDEIKENKVTLKNMKSGGQETLSLKEVIQELKK
jgi:histidyl-tRNA synthetase